jgi:hypothetical protein
VQNIEQKPKKHEASSKTQKAGRGHPALRVTCAHLDARLPSEYAGFGENFLRTPQAHEIHEAEKRIPPIRTGRQKSSLRTVIFLKHKIESRMGGMGDVRFGPMLDAIFLRMMRAIMLVLDAI